MSTLSPDESEFQVQIIQIAYTDQSQNDVPLSTRTITAQVNSLTPQMWLPLDICQEFEKAFGLVWDTASQLYLVGRELHDSLLSRNITITFVIGNNFARTSIDIPYSMFDLRVVGNPYINGSMNYFPLRRADNISQITLGRAFLQRILLTADYDPQTFSIHPAVYNKHVARRIIAIPPPTNGSNQFTFSPDIPSTKTSPSSGVIAGIVIAALTAFVITVYLTVVCYTNRIPFKKKSRPESPDISDVEDISNPQLPGESKHFGELSGKGIERSELDAEKVGELDCSPTTPSELPALLPMFELNERQENP
jgi:hypothetical protein